MVQNKLDKEYFLGYPLFALAAMMNLGLLSVGGAIPGMNGSPPNVVLYDEYGIVITGFVLIQLFALGYIYFNRDIGFFDLAGVDMFLVYATVALIVAPPFLPLFREFLWSEPFAAAAAFLAQSAGFSLISWTN